MGGSLCGANGAVGGGGIVVQQAWLDNLQQSLKNLDELVVPDGPYAGRAASEALGDKAFVEKASRWRPGPDAEGKRKIMVWAKTLKAWMGLGISTVPPEAAPGSPSDAGPWREADEPPVVVPDAPAAALAVAEVAPVQAPVNVVPTSSEWTSAVVIWAEAKMTKKGLLLLASCVLIFFPRLCAAGVALLVRGALRTVTVATSQLAGQLSVELYTIICEGLRAMSIAEEYVLFNTGPDAMPFPAAGAAAYSGQAPGSQRSQPCPPVGWLPWLRACFVGAEVTSALWALVLLRTRSGAGVGGGGG
jgi:hypothetical protein